MKTLLACLVSLALAPALMAQTNDVAVKTTGKNVTIASRGNDVRAVIHDLFTQSDKNYILDPNIRFTLYLSLKDVEFDEALQIILKTAGLKCDLQNGIYYVVRAPRPSTSAPQTDTKPTQSQVKTQEGAKSNGHGESQSQKQTPETTKTKGPLKSTDLQKRVTTRHSKIDLRLLMEDLTKQTGITIYVNEKVPLYKIDAFLINTSLKYALDQISSAAGLRYKLTEDGAIEIVPNVSVEVASSGKVSGKESGGAGHP